MRSCLGKVHISGQRGNHEDFRAQRGQGKLLFVVRNILGASTAKLTDIKMPVGLRLEERQDMTAPETGEKRGQRSRCGGGKKSGTAGSVLRMDTEDVFPGKGAQTTLVLISHCEVQEMQAIMGMAGQECACLSHEPHHQRDTGAVYYDDSG